jgi:metal-dependent hydrolase (beta-lactamase superfamily II)
MMSGQSSTGFTLATPTAEEMGRTIIELQATGPRVVMPAHCTGFAAMRLFAEKMAEEFVLDAVGTRLVF